MSDSDSAFIWFSSDDDSEQIVTETEDSETKISLAPNVTVADIFSKANSIFETLQSFDKRMGKIEEALALAPGNPEAIEVQEHFESLANE